jgi:hypothetical protein
VTTISCCSHPVMMCTELAVHSPCKSLWGGAGTRLYAATAPRLEPMPACICARVQLVLIDACAVTYGTNPYP